MLEEFDEVIKEATFFSIDSEFTGLFSERTPPFITPNDFYQKLQSGTDDYSIVQLGITAFRVDPGKFRTNNFSITAISSVRVTIQICLQTTTIVSHTEATIFMCIRKAKIKICDVRHLV